MIEKAVMKVKFKYRFSTYFYYKVPIWKNMKKIIGNISLTKYSATSNNMKYHDLTDN